MDATDLNHLHCPAEKRELRRRAAAAVYAGHAAQQRISKLNDRHGDEIICLEFTMRPLITVAEAIRDFVPTMRRLGEPDYATLDEIGRVCWDIAAEELT